MPEAQALRVLSHAREVAQKWFSAYMEVRHCYLSCSYTMLATCRQLLLALSPCHGHPAVL